MRRPREDVATCQPYVLIAPAGQCAASGPPEVSSFRGCRPAGFRPHTGLDGFDAPSLLKTEIITSRTDCVSGVGLRMRQNMQMNDTPTSRAPSRRSLFAAAAAAFLLAAGWRASAEPVAPYADVEFMRLSRLLTDRTDLDPRTGHRLNAALTSAYRGFSTQVAACTAFASAHGLTAAESFAAAPK